jgi:hypothetical protein
MGAGRGMHWSAIIVVGVLAAIVLSEVWTPAVEGFSAPRRSDIGLSTDGWREEGGWGRDLRYKEQFVDIQGLGVAADFCRAVSKKGDNGSLQVACALGRRDGMDTLEYRSRTVKEGLRMSRDDYWRANGDGNKMDYCRILKDADTGRWYSSCLVAGKTGFKKEERRDTSPPPAIQELLEAYHGVMTWWRWIDDREDYAQNTAISVHGTPVFPDLLNPLVSRGLQLNRWPTAAQEAGEPPVHTEPRDYLQWGEKDTLHLDQTIQPRQLRAIAFWVHWDAFEKGAMVFEATNGRKDRVTLGIQGPSHDAPTTTRRVASPATEVPPATIQAIGQLTEPARPLTQLHPNERRPISTKDQSATYVFEIWDEEQRIMRLESPMGAAKTGQWQHVVVTTTDNTSWWPEWQMWIDGALVASRTDGRLSPALQLTQNFIGRSFRGCLQDFRIYKAHIGSAAIAGTMAWAKGRLHPLP